jgi:hypothetical protein
MYAKIKTMEEFKFKNIDNYSKRLIDVIAPPECGRQVFQDKYLLFNIFSYFKSGWGIKLRNINHIQYYDIFGHSVIVNQVTDRMTNPYHDKGVDEKLKKNSYYVGPVVKYKSSKQMLFERE